jgi:hypothetical protein
MVSPFPERPTSLYDELADLIEQDKHSLARRMAEEVFADRVDTYAERGIQRLALQFVPHYSMMAQYARTGKPEEWKAYFLKLVTDRKEQGFSFEAVMRTSHFYYKVVFDLIDRHFSGPDNQRKREMYHRRINGMQTLSEITARLVFLTPK